MQPSEPTPWLAVSPYVGGRGAHTSEDAWELIRRALHPLNFGVKVRYLKTFGGDS